MTAATTRMTTELLPAGELILCAVSGGADSMYLLENLRDMGYPVAAAHYDHGLRGADSAADAAFVRDWCETHDIPFRCERGDVAACAEARGLGIEAAARELRYAFLERTADALGASVIATAHTADDNAETVLLHLTRGTGLRGLGGIPPIRGRIVRPMLDVTRGEVLIWLEEHSVPHVEDASNASDVYARNRLRHHVIPRLREENPALAETISRTARLLREDEAFLGSLAEGFIAQNARDHALPLKALATLPDPVARRVLRRMAGESLGFEHTVRALDALRQGKNARLPGVELAVSEGWVRFSRGEFPRLKEHILVPGETLELPEAGLTVSCKKIDIFPCDVHTSFNTFFFRCANINDTVVLSARRAGDRFRPLGRGCTKTLKALFLEAHVPLWERDVVPVLRDADGILAVRGFPPDERAAAHPGDRDILSVEFLRLMPEKEG